MKSCSGRVVEPELLDFLPPEDRRAMRSRRDLRRLNRCMDHPRSMARALSAHLRKSSGVRIVELGAGDGHFLLGVARRLRAAFPMAQATLVDRLDSFDPKIGHDFENLGWSVCLERKTAVQWLSESGQSASDAIVCNLFLHQFQSEELSEMLRLAGRSTKLLVALEPRRSRLPRLCGRLLWMIGCGPVTRHDAGISVRAGFYGKELSEIWGDTGHWSLTERRAGLFSHLFIAQRKDD